MKCEICQNQGLDVTDGYEETIIEREFIAYYRVVCCYRCHNLLFDRMAKAKPYMEFMFQAEMSKVLLNLDPQKYTPSELENQLRAYDAPWRDALIACRVEMKNQIAFLQRSYATQDDS